MKNYELKGVSCDYSKKENWLNIPEITKESDTFYIYPTSYIDPSPEALPIATIDNATMHTAANIIYGRQATAFMESTNVFAPYYRQGNLSVLAKMSAKEMTEYQHQEQRTDIFGALDYYFEH